MHLFILWTHRVLFGLLLGFVTRMSRSKRKSCFKWIEHVQVSSVLRLIMRHWIRNEGGKWTACFRLLSLSSLEFFPWFFFFFLPQVWNWNVQWQWGGQRAVVFSLPPMARRISDVFHFDCTLFHFPFWQHVLLPLPVARHCGIFFHRSITNFPKQINVGKSNTNNKEKSERNKNWIGIHQVTACTNESKWKFIWENQIFLSQNKKKRLGGRMKKKKKEREDDAEKNEKYNKSISRAHFRPILSPTWSAALQHVVGATLFFLFTCSWHAREKGSTAH